jgi:hypothetical protein
LAKDPLLLQEFIELNLDKSQAEFDKQLKSVVHEISQDYVKEGKVVPEPRTIHAPQPPQYRNEKQAVNPTAYKNSKEVKDAMNPRAFQTSPQSPKQQHSNNENHISEKRANEKQNNEKPVDKLLGNKDETKAVKKENHPLENANENLQYYSSLGSYNFSYSFSSSFYSSYNFTDSSSSSYSSSSSGSSQYESSPSVWDIGNAPNNRSRTFEPMGHAYVTYYLNISCNDPYVASGITFGSCIPVPSESMELPLSIRYLPDEDDCYYGKQHFYASWNCQPLTYLGYSEYEFPTDNTDKAESCYDVNSENYYYFNSTNMYMSMKYRCSWDSEFQFPFSGVASVNYQFEGDCYDEETIATYELFATDTCISSDFMSFAYTCENDMIEEHLYFTDYMCNSQPTYSFNVSDGMCMENVAYQYIPDSTYYSYYGPDVDIFEENNTSYARIVTNSSFSCVDASEPSLAPTFQPSATYTDTSKPTTRTPTTVPSTSPTISPSFAPITATSSIIQFEVKKRINGFTAAEFYSADGAEAAFLKIVADLLDIDSEDVYGLTVTDASRRLREVADQQRSSHAKETAQNKRMRVQASSVDATYTVRVVATADSGLSYSSFYDTLSSAVSDGSFTSKLQSSGVTIFASAEADSIAITNLSPTASPTKAPSSSSSTSSGATTIIIIAVVVGVVGIGGLIGLVVYCSKRNAEAKVGVV